MKFYILLRLSSLGDIILASGLPRYIKRNEPEAKVVFISGNSFSGILDKNPYVDIDVKYEKESMDTQPLLPELCRKICEIAEGSPKIEIHFADLQNNKRSYSLLYLFKQYLRKEVVECDLYLSHLELEKYRSAKLAMVWSRYLPEFLIKRISLGAKNQVKLKDYFQHIPKNLSNNKEIYNDSLAKIQGLKKLAKKNLLIRNSLKLPYISLRYYDTVYGKGLAKRSARSGRSIRIRPEIWLQKDVEANKYKPLNRKRTSQKPYLIGLAPGAAHFTKQWPKEKYINLADILIEKGYEVLIIGGPKDNDLIDDIIQKCKRTGINKFVSQGDIQDTTATIDALTALICGDTALSHIAYSRKIHVFTIFGSTVPELGFVPRSYDFHVIQDNNVECRPCTHIGRSSCPKGHFNCMNNIEASEIANQLDLYIEESVNTK